MTPAPDSTPAFSLPPGETPLGIQHPLGLSLLQPKFLTPLGAQPLTVLNPATFSSLRPAEVSDIAAPFQDSPFFDAPPPIPSPKPAAARSVVPSVQAAPLPNPPSNRAPAIADFPPEAASGSAPVEAVSEVPGWEGDPEVAAIAPPESTPAIQAFPEDPDPAPAIAAPSDAIALPPSDRSGSAIQAFPASSDPSAAIAPTTSTEPTPAIQAFSDSPVPSPAIADPPAVSDAIAPPPSDDSAPAIQAFSDSPVPSPAIADPPAVSDAIARFPEPETASDAAAPEPTRSISEPAEASSTLDPSVAPVSSTTPFPEAIAATAPPLPLASPETLPPAIPSVTPTASAPAIARAPLPAPEIQQTQPANPSQAPSVPAPDVTLDPQPAVSSDDSDTLPDLSPALEPAAVASDSSIESPESPSQASQPLSSAAPNPVALEPAPPSLQAAAIAQSPPSQSVAGSESAATELRTGEPATVTSPDIAAEPVAESLPIADLPDVSADADADVTVEPDRNLSSATSRSEPDLQLKAEPASTAVSSFSDVEAALPAPSDMESDSPAAAAAPPVPTESGLGSEEVVQRSPASAAAPSLTASSEASGIARPPDRPQDAFPAVALEGISAVEPTRTTALPDQPEIGPDFSPAPLQRAEVSPELAVAEEPTLQRAEVSPELDADGGAIAAIQPSALPDLDQVVPADNSVAQPPEVAEPDPLTADQSVSSPPSESTIQRATLTELEATESFSPAPTAETADLTSVPPPVQAFQEPDASPEIPDARSDSADIAVSDQAPVLQAKAESPPAASSPTLDTAASIPTGDFNAPATDPEQSAPEVSLGVDQGDDTIRTPAPTSEPASPVEMPTIQLAGLPTDTGSPVSDSFPTNPATEVASEATDTPVDVATASTPIPELPSVIQRLSVWEPLVQAQGLGTNVPLFQEPVIQRAPAPAPPISQSGGSDRTPPGRSDSAPNGYQVPNPNSSGSATPDSWSSIAELLSSSGTSEANGSSSSSANSSGASTPDSWSNIAELAAFNSPASEVPAIAPSSGYSELQLYPEPSATPDLQTSLADTIQRNSASPVAMPAAPPEPSTQSAGESAQAANASPEALEKLALEIYRLVLQRLALERERLGHTYSGRLPW